MPEAVGLLKLEGGDVVALMDDLTWKSEHPDTAMMLSRLVQARDVGPEHGEPATAMLRRAASMLGAEYQPLVGAQTASDDVVS